MIESVKRHVHWFLWIGAAIIFLSGSVRCGGESFIYRGDFVVNPEASSASVNLSLIRPFLIQSVGNPPEPRTVDSYFLGPNLWGNGLTALFASPGPSSARGLTEATVSWEDNLFIYDWHGENAARGATVNGMDFAATAISFDLLFGTARLEISTSSQPYGFPLYSKVQSRPYETWQDIRTGYGGTWSMAPWEENVYNINQNGPDWSKIQNWIEPDEETLIQSGDIVDFNINGIGSITAGSLNGELSEAKVGLRAETEVLTRVAPVLRARALRPNGGQSFYNADATPRPCQFACLAMIMDDWAQRYPQLKKPVESLYYLAFQKSFVETTPWIERFLKMANDYFAAKNRSGTPAPLVLVGPKDLYRCNPDRLKNPIIIMGKGGVKNGGQEEFPAHVFVMDAYQIYERYPRSSSETATWVSVRDTWPGDHGYAVTYEDGDPTYRGFHSTDGHEWWPLNMVNNELIWFPEWKPNMYRFSPWRYFEVAVQPEVSIMDLFNLDFDFTTDPDDPDTPGKDFMQGLILDGGVVDISPRDSSVKVELKSRTTETGLMYSQLNGTTALTLSFGCYSTKQVVVSFEYSLSSGSTLEVRAGTRLIKTITAPPNPLQPPSASGDIPALTRFSAQYDLASMGMGQDYVPYSLKFSGPAGSQLYLDTLAISNPNGKSLLSDLDIDSEVNLKDFALFAKQWAKSGCVAPGYCSGADLDHTGAVNLADLALLVDEWLK